jgi:pimeloyl-ACP methyl ester carboxylesterase
LSYDLRGFGESRSPLASPRELNGHCLEKHQTISRDYTPAAFAQDLQLLLQELQITDSVWLVGHSLGGTIALWGAAQLPTLVKGVICLNAGGGIYLKEEFERFRSAGEGLVKFRPTWLCRLPLIDILFSRAMVDRPLSRVWGRQRVIDFVSADTTAALGTLLDCTTEVEVHKLPPLVSQLPQPVYFLAGVNDRVMELKYVHHLASFHYLFQSGINNVVEISHCGHIAMLEHPHLVAEYMQEIINKP